MTAQDKAEHAALQRMLAGLPLVTYRTNQSVIRAESKTGRLLLLKEGAVAIIKDGVEIARVTEPGSALGEISALLDRPHTADVQTLEESQFYVADAELEKEPVIVLHVARILAQRLVAADEGLVELKKQFQAGQPASALSKLLENLQAVLNVGGTSYET